MSNGGHMAGWMVAQRAEILSRLSIKAETTESLGAAMGRGPRDLDKVLRRLEAKGLVIVRFQGRGVATWAAATAPGLVAGLATHNPRYHRTAAAKASPKPPEAATDTGDTKPYLWVGACHTCPTAGVTRAWGWHDNVRPSKRPCPLCGAPLARVARHAVEGVRVYPEARPRRRLAYLALLSNGETQLVEYPDRAKPHDISVIAR